MSDLKKLAERVVKFRDARDWKQFHNMKDMAISLSLEATEVLEKFQWKDEEEIKNYLDSKKNDLGEELADVLYWVLLMSHDANVDLEKIFEEKMQKNENKYPVDKAKGTHAKYTEL